MQWIDGVLESFDLRAPLMILALSGVLISVYVMTLTQYEAEDADDPPWIQHTRRVALGLLAWAFLWCLGYANYKSWQPWPPLLLLAFAVDCVLVIRALAIKSRIRRHGVKPQAPRAIAEHLLHH